MKKRTQRSRRSCRGAALIIGSIFALGILIISTPVIIFSANFSTYLIARSQAKHMAFECARVIDQCKYWLALPRPDFTARSEQDARANADKALQLMARAYGFGKAEATYSFRPSQSSAGEETVCDLTVDIRDKIAFKGMVFGFDMSSFYPTKLSLQATTEHRSDLGPYGLMHLDCSVEPPAHPFGFVTGPGEGPPQNRGVAVLPSFGFWHHVPPDHGKLAPYGKLGGFQGTADITETKQFAAMNLTGFTTRNDLIRVLHPDTKGAIARGGVEPGGYITTGYLQPSSYHH